MTTKFTGGNVFFDIDRNLGQDKNSAGRNRPKYEKRGATAAQDADGLIAFGTLRAQLMTRNGGY